MFVYVNIILKVNIYSIGYLFYKCIIDKSSFLLFFMVKVWLVSSKNIVVNCIIFVFGLFLFFSVVMCFYFYYGGIIFDCFDGGILGVYWFFWFYIFGGYVFFFGFVCFNVKLDYI